MPRNQKTARPKKSLKFLKISGQVVLVGAAIGLIYFVGNLFRVRTIHCSLDGHECPPVLITSLNKLQNQFLLFHDFKKISTENGLPVPATLTKVEKSLPHTIALSFTSETLEYQLQTDQGIVAISQSGMIFHDIPDQGETLIEIKPSFNQLIAPNGQLQPEIHATLQTLTESIAKSKLSVSHVTWVDKDTILLIMNEGTITGILDSTSPTTELEKLEVILQSEEYQKVAQTVKEIDVRFKLPVLRMKQ